MILLPLPPEIKGLSDHIQQLSFVFVTIASVTGLRGNLKAVSHGTALMATCISPFENLLVSTPDYWIEFCYLILFSFWYILDVNYLLWAEVLRGREWETGAKLCKAIDRLKPWLWRVGFWKPNYLGLSLAPSIAIYWTPLCVTQHPHDCEVSPLGYTNPPWASASIWVCDRGVSTSALTHLPVSTSVFAKCLDLWFLLLLFCFYKNLMKPRPNWSTVFGITWISVPGPQPLIYGLK